MKKSGFGAAFFAALILASSAVFAANGDIAGDIYTTDILTQVDGRDIPSYSLDGEMLIALEDLEPYGFSVRYDDSIRTVFINQTGEAADDFKPTVKRGSVGGKAGYYYESDIAAYVNGQYVRAYSLDGKMVAKVEEIGNIIGDAKYYGVSIGKYDVSPYLMSYSYDDSQRLLSLYTGKNKLPSKEEIKDAFKNNGDEFWFFDKEVPLEGGSVLIGGQHGTPHGTQNFIAYVGDDSLYMPLYGVFASYGFTNFGGSIRAYDFEADGEYITFSGTRRDGREGKYRLDPRTFYLEVIEEIMPTEEQF